MSRFIAMIAAPTAALSITVPASAAHDANPSPRVATHTYDIGELNDSGAEGTVRITALPNGKVQVKVETTSLRTCHTPSTCMGRRVGLSRSVPRRSAG